MTSIENLLKALCPEIESRIKPQLPGLTGLIFKSYLPQVWVFKTEHEVVTLLVDIQGDALVFPGEDEGSDVVIEWNHDLLTSVLSKRSREGIPGVAAPIVNARSVRGREAFNYLKGALGL